MSAGTPAPSGCNFSHAAAGISSHDVAERLPIPGAFFTDGRRLDFAIDGVHWWRLIILAGYSRTMLAGMIAPTEATWVVIMVLYTTCLRYGALVHLVSDSEGAYTSADVEAVCTRLQIRHEMRGTAEPPPSATAGEK